jgi:hypothetical protein
LRSFRANGLYRQLTQGFALSITHNLQRDAVASKVPNWLRGKE